MSTKPIKLNTALARRELGEKNWKNALQDLVEKFSKNQSLFRGTKKTYTAYPGFADEPGQREFRLVQSTVQEQFDWLSKHNEEFLNTLFSIEATNASGTASAELTVEGESWGVFDSLQLLRLKGILESALFKSVYENVPVRTATKNWNLSANEDYTGRRVYETEMDEGEHKTSQKESYILHDPHAGEGDRPPMIGEKLITQVKGKFTMQEFSGEVSLQDRAVAITRLTTLLDSVIQALERANDTELKSSDLGTKFLNFVTKGLR